MTILETKNLSKSFDGVKAVDDLSLKIEKGKIIGLVGPNGSGKTTLINVLSGFLPLDQGVVVFGGKGLKKIISYEMPFYGLTRTFQNIRLFEQMTVLDNILVVLTSRHVLASIFEKHGSRHLEQTKAVLEKVSLWEKRNSLACHLSYGQRKLLEIARAMAMQVEIFLFDEPFAGLFPEMRKIVSSNMNELKKTGKTIILIEHDMALIRELCDHVVVLDSGALLAQGQPEKVLAQPEVLEAYLGA